MTATSRMIEPLASEANHGEPSRNSGARSSRWAQSAEAVAKELDVTVERGLSSAEVVRRRARFGRNQLREHENVSALTVLTNQFASVVVWLLVAAASLSLFLGDLLEATAIAAAVVLTVMLGFATELRAMRSMEALRRLGTQEARVRRDGEVTTVAAIELVPGDVILVDGGDRISADLRIARASRLQSDESVLTGESVPVGKRVDVLADDTPLADRRNMLYKGSSVARGSGLGIVVATGMRSELGRIASLVETSETEETPLERELAALGRTLLWACLVVAAATTLVGILGGRAATVMITTGVALAVAAIPEGLPVVATIALARGMWRLAARHALIKRLSAVETLGATNVILVDKTGTLTANQLSVVAWRSADGAEPPAASEAALEIAALCNNASFGNDAASGDPLEIALLRAARDGGLDLASLSTRLPRVREEAFDPNLKMMATVHRDGGLFRVAVKGAPEAVMAACSSRRVGGANETLTPEMRASIETAEQHLAGDGLRVLALAERTSESQEGDLYADLSFVGLVGFADPPRVDVAEPLAACRAAGIRVIMATGDQPATAASIARSVKLTAGEPRIVSGRELSEYLSNSDEQSDLLMADVFARVAPDQKLHIVEALQSSGATVAMTGDGVNDAPALRRAQIGVAMGKRGTDVAREAADMVLVDDSFQSIVVAIEQGRAIFENVRRFVVYLLSCNLSEVLIVSGAILFRAPLALLPLQILFLNLVTDVFPALALGFSKGSPSAMSVDPRPANEPIVTRRHWASVVGYALVITAATLGAMAISLRAGATASEATSVSFLTLAFAQLWHVFNMRGANSSLRKSDVTSNPWVWGALGLCVALLALAAVGPLADVLRVVPLDGAAWVTIATMSVVPLFVGQIALTVLGKRSKKETT